MRGTGIFRCEKQQAAFVADCANLRHEQTEEHLTNWESMYPMPSDMEFWQDKQTGGGAGRIVWKAHVAWVSCHSGYWDADITSEICDIFRELGCEELDQRTENSWYNQLNPHIYGWDRWTRDEWGRLPENI
jgi:hypothetical protein